MALPVEYIRQQGQLKAAVEEIVSTSQIAVDTEANSRHAYPEQLCLIQIATPQKIYIIDPILLDSTELLRPVFSDTAVTKVFHTAEYDIRSMNRHLGFETRNVYDVAIAAQFIGIAKFGLAGILQELLNIQVKKNKKIQESDWKIRPLSKEVMEYAVDDVRYLLSLKAYLDNKLYESGRSDWVREECMRLEQLRYEPRDSEKAYLRVKNARRLSSRGLAVLKSLFSYREKEALRQNRPPQYLLPDITLTHLADNPEAPLTGVPELNKRRLQRFEFGIKDALIVGMNEEPIYLDDERDSYYPMDEKSKKRLQLLKEWRESVAGSLSLDPSLIWPRSSLDRLAENPTALNNELASIEVRQWQKAEFTASLTDLLKTRTTFSS